MFSSWSRTQRSTPRRAAGGSLTLRAESRATRRCTKLASRATRLRKIATMSSPVTHLNIGNELLARVPIPVNSEAAALRGLLKKAKKQIPRELKPARDDKNKGLVRHR